MNHKIVSELISAGYRVIPPSTAISNPEAVYKALTRYAKKDQEHVILLSLDNQNSILSTDVIFIGTSTGSLFQPREVFVQALKRKAINVIIAHNHPSGSTYPSPEDLEATKILIHAGQIIGINCLDHLIISRNGFTSLRSDHSYLWN